MSTIHQVCRKWAPSRVSRSNERGQALVEAALTFPLLFLLFFGIIEFSLVIFSYNTISNAAREGARWGIVSTTVPRSKADIENHVSTLALPVDCASPGMKPTATVTTATVRVDIECNVPLMTQMIVTALGGTGTIPLQASATMQVE
jgi:Flp pilus assembly protein TadG